MESCLIFLPKVNLSVTKIFIDNVFKYIIYLNQIGTGY